MVLLEKLDQVSQGRLIEAAAFLKSYSLFSSQLDFLSKGAEKVIQGGAKAGAFIADKIAELGRNLQKSEHKILSRTGDVFTKADGLKDSLSQSEKIKLSKDINEKIGEEKTKLEKLNPDGLKEEFLAAVVKVSGYKGEKGDLAAVNKTAMQLISDLYRVDTRMKAVEDVEKEAAAGYLAEYAKVIREKLAAYREDETTEKVFSDEAAKLPAEETALIRASFQTENISYLTMKSLINKENGMDFSPATVLKKGLGYYLGMLLVLKTVTVASGEQYPFPSFMVLSSFLSIALLPVGGIIIAGLAFYLLQNQNNKDFVKRLLSIALMPLYMEYYSR